MAFCDDENEEVWRVLVSISMKNESGKYYFCLDNPDFTNYPDEQEVLLQAGLIFTVKEIVQIDDDLMEVKLETSEKMIHTHQAWQRRRHIIPFVSYCLAQFVQFLIRIDSE